MTTTTGGTTDDASDSTQPPAGPARQRPDQLWGRAGAAFDTWLAGDPAGLDELVEVMTPVLWHVVRAYRLPRESAEDVVQTTWLALVRRSADIADSGAVGGWLTTVARREAWRVAGAGARTTPLADEDLAPRLPSVGSAEGDAVEQDERRRLWAVVDGLPERCRRLLRVVAFEHRPDYSRLAGDLDMPIGSIGPTRGRCLAKLRVALMQAGVK
ncbi:RNA polymerase sigma factor [Nocardioides pantholopis]|uniref:RNA polymerase sigma factor n=1 Tax=Nocardioides pantholopis TaxID=2483798 RepID=UPI000F096A87|nr:sigma-70 family RNA polymerase sigma factor [Nocardioides pantholopis]